MIRNGEVHGKTTASRVQAKRREVARQVTEIYASRDFMEPEAQALLVTDQDTQMQQPTYTTTNWLAMTGPVLRDSVRRIKKVSLQGVQSLGAYFPRSGDG